MSAAMETLLVHKGGTRMLPKVGGLVRRNEGQNILREQSTVWVVGFGLQDSPMLSPSEDLIL